MEIKSSDKVMRIGELARLTGISKQLIHYYLRMRYLHPPVYKEGNQAYYDLTHLNRLRFLQKSSADAIPLAYAASLWERQTDQRSKTRVKYQAGSSVQSNTREQIIEEASIIFLRKGYNNTTIAEIMDNIGITKPSFYYYFKNKKDLYLTCLDSIFDSFSKRALDSIRKESEPLRRLEQRWKEGHTHSRQLLISLNLLKESMRQEDHLQRERAAKILKKSWVDPLARDLEKGMKKGQIRAVESEIISYALISLLETFTYRETLDHKYGAEVVLEAVYDLILHGLLPAE